MQMENQRLYTIIDRLNTRGSDHTSDTASQLSDLSSYAPREVSQLCLFLSLSRQHILSVPECLCTDLTRSSAIGACLVSQGCLK